MNWFERHMSWTFLIALVAFLAITLSISIWVGEQEGWIVFGAIPAALAGYVFGANMERSRVGKKERKAKEDARSMIESRSTYTQAKDARQYVMIEGVKHSEERYWEVLQILEQEAKRHRNEAESEEGILEELQSLRK